MKSLSSGIVIVFTLAFEANAFLSNTNSVFGSRRTGQIQSHRNANPVRSSTFLTMAVLPDDDEPRKRNEVDASSSSSSSQSDSSIPFAFNDELMKDMMLPDDENDLPSLSSVTRERQDRMKREADAKSRFLHGDDLIESRKYTSSLETEIKEAREVGDISRLNHLTEALEDSQKLDAEYVFLKSIRNMNEAERKGLEEEAAKHRLESEIARECLPQFQLGGLWVGKYGEHGYEMLNVTYIGEHRTTLVATKVTGDKNVPKGEISFTADLHPEAKGRNDLEAIELSDVASKQWGHKHLPRFPGEGQVAAEGFVNNQWMDGQLILVGEYFSFAWLPLGHQIFFGRPSAELTLKMIKQSKMSDYGAVDKDSPNAIAEQRAFAQRCFDETELLIYEDEGEGELCFLEDDEGYFTQEGCFE